MSDVAWAIRVPCDAVPRFGGLRLVPGVEVCEVGAEVWLRGPKSDPKLERALDVLPGVARYAVLASKELVPNGKRVPSGRLPEGAWGPLPAWLGVSSPSPGAPAEAGQAPLSLVRSAMEREPNLLVTDIGTWLGYARGAPKVRLKPLAFAASEDGRVVVVGKPLPPIEGAPFSESHGVAVPCGWAWSPPVDDAVVAGLLALPEQDLAIFRPDGTWEHVPKSGFVRATRGAARITADELLRNRPS